MAGCDVHRPTNGICIDFCIRCDSLNFHFEFQMYSICYQYQTEVFVSGLNANFKLFINDRRHEVALARFVEENG